MLDDTTKKKIYFNFCYTLKVAFFYILEQLV